MNAVAVCDPLPLDEELTQAKLGLLFQGGIRGGQMEVTRITIWSAEWLPALETRVKEALK